MIIYCCTRESLGWRLSDNGSSKTAEAALEEALVHRLHSSATGPAPRQRPCLQQSAVHGEGEGLRAHSGVHDALYTGAKRTCRTFLTVLEGRVHLATSVRIAGPGTSGDQPLDLVLQCRTATSDHGLCGTPSTPGISGVRCAEARG